MKRFLKWIGLVLLGLLVLAICVVGFLNLQVRSDVYASYALQPVALEISEPDSLMLERGAHLATLNECTGCHTKDLSGQIFVDDPMMGTIGPSNLTSGEGGIGASYTDEDWVRAIRYGIKPNGEPLVIMPVDRFIRIGKSDLVALIAYLKQLPPVDNVIPLKKIGPMLPVMVRMNSFDIVKSDNVDHDTPIPDSPTPGVTPEYGAYLANSCRGCHDENLAGKVIFGSQSSNLTALQDWRLEDFTRAVQEGVRPSGDSLAVGMPRWKELEAEELGAIWAYVKTLDPLPDNVKSGS